MARTLPAFVAISSMARQLHAHRRKAGESDTGQRNQVAVGDSKERSNWALAPSALHLEIKFGRDKEFVDVAGARSARHS